ncbi:MAG: DNA polymerase III subunit delta [Oligoflexia bacterium]|nr:DNA polymerase III subunit delta [Oligoflexia bacterium]
MSSVDSKLLAQQLDRGQIASLYFLHGEETFMVDESLEKIKEKVLTGGAADFNYSVFYASDADVESICDAVETLPMMSQRRLVIVKQAQDLSASELERLTVLVEKPVESTCLVLVASKADMRKKFFKLFESKGVMVKFQKPFENQLNPWITYIAKKYSKELSPEAAELLKESVGSNLTDINNELCKAAQYVGERSRIEVDDIRATVSRIRVHTVFELVNCMGNGDCANSFTHLAHLLDSGQNEVGVLAMIIRHFRILMLCQEALREGLSQAQIASRVGVHGFFVKEYIDQARKQDFKQLIQIYDVLLDTDRALKSNPLSSHLWLENLVLQACRQATPESTSPKVSY